MVGFFPREVHDILFFRVQMFFVIHKLNVDAIENNTWSRGDMEFIFECSHRYRTSERSERVRYRM